MYYIMQVLHPLEKRVKGTEKEQEMNGLYFSAIHISGKTNEPLHIKETTEVSCESFMCLERGELEKTENKMLLIDK